MPLLITSDTHFSDNPRDEFRFALFAWLAKHQELYKVDGTLILGDLCQEKDRHSSLLVNKIVKGLELLKPPIYILTGNHDGINLENPFFKFVNAIPGIKFFTEPTLLENLKIVMIPYQTSQAAFTAACRMIPQGWGVCIHNTITGAIAETGSPMTGFSASLIAQKAAWCLAGDVHKPQSVGPVTYVGSPYAIRFGDVFTPRVLLLDSGKETNLYFPAPKKLSLNIRDVSEIPKLTKGDQVKVTLELTRSEAVEWSNHKKAIIDHCKHHNIEIFGMECKIAEGVKNKREAADVSSKSNLEYFEAFCRAEKVPTQIKDSGIKLLS
jgi:Calcineurin-like phosphoesterase